MLAKTDQIGIVRDLNNNALLANDISSLHSHREEFRKRQEMNNKLKNVCHFVMNYKKLNKC